MRRFLPFASALLLAACGSHSSQTAVLPARGVQQYVVQHGFHDAKFLVFPEPGGQTNLYPFQLTKGPDGKIWFTVQQYDGGGQIGNIDNAGNITQYPIPVRAYPWDITVAPDGLLWFVDTRNSVIGSVTTSGVITTYSAQAYGSLTSGPQRAIWFAGGSGLGRVAHNGKITYFSLPYKVLAVTHGPDGNLWFTNGQITEDPRLADIPTGPTIIGSMTPSGSYTIYTVPGATGEGVGITSGNDGNVWALIENGSAPAMIVRVKPATGEMKVFTLPGDILGVDNNRIISAPSGELWYTRNSAAPTQYIGRISLTGQIYERLYPTPDRFISFLGGLAYGKDGNIWFSQTNPIQDGIGVFERHDLDVNPPRVKLRSVGQTMDVTVTERYHDGGWTAVTSDPSIATVAQGGNSNVFTITAVGAGTAIVTISDSKDNDFEVPVTVVTP